MLSTSTAVIESSSTVDTADGAAADDGAAANGDGDSEVSVLHH